MVDKQTDSTPQTASIGRAPESGVSVEVSSKQNTVPPKPLLTTTSRDGLVFHNVTFSTAENGSATRTLAANPLLVSCVVVRHVTVVVAMVTLVVAMVTRHGIDCSLCNSNCDKITALFEMV